MADATTTNGNEESQQPLWVAPDFQFPSPNSTVVPGARIKVSTGSSSLLDWRVQIMQRENVVKEFTGGGYSFETTMPAGIIGYGEVFYIRAEYKKLLIWSAWGYSGDLRMVGEDTPYIGLPVDGGFVTTDTPKVSGTGHPKAIMNFYEANSGVTLYGTKEVDVHRNWEITLAKLPHFPFKLIAEQKINGEAAWSNVVTINFLKKPEISKPGAGSTVKRDNVVASGEGATPHATIMLQEIGTNKVYGTTTVGDAGGWSTPLNRLPLGRFYFRAIQSAGGVDSEPSAQVGLTVVL